MGYVSESSNDIRARPFGTRWQGPNSSLESSRNFTCGRERQQYGYRSGPLTVEEKNSLTLKHGGTWASSTNDRALLDYQYKTNPDTFRVNDRRYSDFIIPDPAVITGTANGKLGNGSSGGTGQFIGQGLLAISNANADWNPTGSPPPPTEEEMASSMAPVLRGTIPAKPGVNLARFVGEQKDFPQLLARSNYVPKNIGDTGGSYLNIIFGIQPSVSDLQKTTEVALKSTEVLGEFLKSESRLLRRQTTVTDDSVDELATRIHSNANYGNFASGITGPFGVRYAVGNINPARLSVLTIDFAVDFQLRYRRERSAFGTYKYFVPQPEGLHQRIASYSQKAKRLLGGGFNASTAYDLTPYSWLANWFIDFGGLLRYQQVVADNNMVALRQGTSFYQETSVTATVRLLDARTTSPSADVNQVSLSGSSARMSRKRHNRSKGNPYSLSPSWDFSPQQAAIVAALGISKTPW